MGVGRRHELQFIISCTTKVWQAGDGRLNSCLFADLIGLPTSCLYRACLLTARRNRMLIAGVIYFCPPLGAGANHFEIC